MESLTKNKTVDVKKMVTLAMFAAMAYLIMVVGRIPMVLFLKYDPKDIVITIAGFLYGPFAALMISLVVCLVEMVTVSSEGIIGFIMNFMSTAVFACTAALIYKKKPSLKSAVLGLVAGALLMTAMMILWNYFIVPMYMKVTRETVAGMLLPVFLPFNLVKSGLNAAITMLLYKPVVLLLRKSHLVPESSGGGSIKTGVMAISALVLITFILFALILKGVI